VTKLSIKKPANATQMLHSNTEIKNEVKQNLCQ